MLFDYRDINPKEITTIQLSQNSCYFLPLRSEQHPLFRHPQSISNVRDQVSHAQFNSVCANLYVYTRDGR